VTRRNLSSYQEAEVNTTASLKDGSVLTKGRCSRRQARTEISDEVTSPGKQQSVLLDRIGTGLVSSDLVELLTPTIPFIGHLIPGAESCIIFLFDPIKHQLSPGASVNLSQDFINLLHTKEQEEGLITAALKQADSHFVIYLPGNKHFESLRKLAHKEGIRTLWLVPWRDRDANPLGALLFASGQAFSPDKQALASATLLTEWMSAVLHEAHTRQDNERCRVAPSSINELELSIDDTDKIANMDQTLRQSTRPEQDPTTRKQNRKVTSHSFAGNRDKQSIVVPRYKDKHGIPVLYDSSTLERRNHAEPDPISVLSHELLSPLTLIKGYTATLLQLADDITDEQKTQYLQGIGSATNRVIHSLENIRNISRLEIDIPNLIVQPTFLPDLLRKTVSEIQFQTTKHVIKLRQFGPLPPVNIDRQKIEQVMNNLLINAVKYSPQRGDIEVIVRQAHSEHELEEILGEVPPPRFPCLIISVTDSGIGIPEAEKEHVFERFYRVDNRLTRSTPGSGLGLYICKTIIEAHGGHIWVNSVLREGSTFSFHLPVD
jgi:nitrogen-specific signal transduction histidine kinase